MKNIILKTNFTVPIYKAPVWVFVAHDVVKARRRQNKRFGTDPTLVKGDRAAFYYNNGHFGLFFPADLNSDDIAHEVRHLADEIMDWIGHKGCKCKEPATYLNGYLHSRVSDIFHKNKIKIHRK